MNYKKLVLSLAALLCLATAAFADVAVKDLGKDGVAITFTYKDNSSEMGVIGSFDNWTVPGEAMTKNAAGLWEVTLKAASTDEITYKFYSKGSWIQDDNAPDHKDDGYGGKNGLIVVADILSGAVSATPGAPPVVATGPKKPAGRPKLAWGTQTYVESTTTFSTGGGAFSVNDSAVTAYSLWKFNGDLIANMPGHFDITAFKGKSKVYDNGVTKLDATTGSENLAGGILFSPFYYLGGNQRPTIDKFSFGVDTPYVVFDTGYANSPLPAHKSILWDTVSTPATAVYGSTPLTAGAGYSLFRLGPKAKEWGDFTVDLGVVPNRSLSGSYGLYGWTSVEAYGVKLEVQYDHKAADAASTDATKYFQDATRRDLVYGAEAYFLDGFFVRGQYLSSLFAEGTSGALLEPRLRSAFKVETGYSDTYGDFEALFGYGYRGGVAAQLLYLTVPDNNNVLGTPAAHTLSFKGFQKAGYWGTFKWDTSMVTPSIDSTVTNVAYSVRPGVAINFDTLNLYPLIVEVYTKLDVNTEPAPGTPKAKFTLAGSKFAFKGFSDVYYKYDNSVKDALFQTLLSETTVAPGLKAQAGFGLRSGNAVKNNGAFVLGAKYAIDSPEFKTPTVYTQFAYNMDPFNADNAAGALSYDLTDFGPTNGVAAYDGVGALRIGIEWNF